MTGAIRQLCFTLAAPYGAWGAESQPSATTAWKATELDPPKSAIVGLLAAALGVERSGLAPLAASVRIAVRTGLRPERDLRPDYHTISRARRPADRTHWSRFEELRPALSGLDTSGSLLSAREHWSCGLWSVAVATATTDGDTLLERMAAALRAPRWPLYAGRKACPLGLPPDPEALDASGPVAALAAYRWPWERHPALMPVLAPLVTLKRQRAEVETLSWDQDYPGAPAAEGKGPAGAAEGWSVRPVWRRDQPDPRPLPGGRIHQRFQERTELRGAFPSQATEAGER
ncbi:type I-E CRISPR-associated protein Cas5/CasD [Azospirillum sp. A1-3]|uniref:type I-E CRISPR-associated protein Cas5/CasD n=1 Tax=Azospirillum sp. A1-3 TaxID=185874 RepID=UPI002077794D|nr:type I-E CRISPR-associated protein Cas5/CasD [Azospirillum sp. A1-3]MCM8738629.1 type I-E CRISPR-associated protein Cas5/CasD [Azospirillum sp. A1-3]